MADSAELQAVKADGVRLCELLGLPPGEQDHKKCITCESHDALQVYHDPKGGIWGWKCYSCGKGGTIVDAYMAVNKKSLKEALRELCGNHRGPRPYRPPAQQAVPPLVRYGRDHAVPVPDLAAMEPFIKRAHEHLLKHMDLIRKHERGLTEDVVRRFRVGFLEDARIQFPRFKYPYLFRATWTLPITDAAGVVKSVKLHHEEKPRKPNGEVFEGKCSWASFGTEPKYNAEKSEKPVDSFYTLWPWPDSKETFTTISADPVWWVQQLPQNGVLREKWDGQIQWERYHLAYELSKTDTELTEAEGWQAIERAFAVLGQDIQRYVAKTGRRESAQSQGPAFDPDDYIFVCPGELKALAHLSDGLTACAPTGGESWIPPPTMLSCFRGRRVCLPYDDDLPRVAGDKVVCAGREWARRMWLALERENPLAVCVVTGGRAPLAAADDEDVEL